MEQSKAKKYTPLKLKNALHDIRAGKLKVLEACKLYNIPRTTLYFKLSGGRPEEFCRPGPPAILGLDVETKIERWLLDNYKRGFPLSKNGLMYSVKKIIETYPEHVRHKLPFKNNMPGRKWFASFKCRHPKIVEKLGEHKYLAKMTITDAKVRAWFSKAKALIEEEGATDALSNPKRVFYMDEMCLYVSSRGDLLFTDKRKAIYNISHNYIDNVTILFAANATGNFVPPAAVYKINDESHQSRNTVPPHWGVARTKTGWMNCESFYEYITNVFYPYLQKSNVEFPVIVFLDSNFTCTSLPLSIFCEEHGIILLSTLPKIVHFLQPLHGFFTLIRTVWKNELNEWLNERNEENESTECQIPPLVDCILEKKIFESTVVDGFRLSKLYPFEMKPDEGKEEPLLPPPSTNTDTGRQCDCNFSVIEYIESKIPPEVLNKFHACKIKDTPWQGYVGYSALYDLWTEVIAEKGFSEVKKEDPLAIREILLETNDNALDHFVLEEEIEES